MEKIKEGSKEKEIISLLIENKNLKKRNNFCFFEKIKLEKPFFLIFHNRIGEILGKLNYCFKKIDSVRFDAPYKFKQSPHYPAIISLYSGNKRIASLFPSEFLKDINKFIFFNELEGRLLFELKYETNYKKEKMEKKIRFGPSGIQKNIFKEKKLKTLDIPRWIKNENLDAYEFCFGTSFNMKLETAEKIGIEAEKEDILISLHAPYYINLGSPNKEAEEKDFKRLEKSLEYLKLMKGKNLVFHVGSVGKETRDIVLERIKKRIVKFLKKIENDVSLKNIFLCPETMGKYSQVGNPDEIIDICSLNEKLIPTFDFGHINCLLQGNLNEEEIKRIFLLSFEKLGDFRTKNCHIHFSKIEYGPKGEKKHLNYSNAEFGPDFKMLGKIIKELELTPTIITESATDMLDDAKTLKNIFNEEI